MVDSRALGVVLDHKVVVVESLGGLLSLSQLVVLSGIFKGSVDGAEMENVLGVHECGQGK